MDDLQQPVIEVEGLTKSFAGKVVVDSLSLQVREGEIYGFLGPNGSGKTTFIRMLCGLLKPDRGRGTCLGYDIIRDAAQIKFQVGYMAQRFSLYEDLSVSENLEFIGRLYRLRQPRQQAAAIMERMALAPFAEQPAGTLSGGWKQRLALAACLLHKPKLLLLDEPTAGVDPKARRDFWDELYQLTGEGITVLISTHYMDEAERCHRLAYLSFGRLLIAGTAEEMVLREGLITWLVSGDRMHELAKTLTGLPGVEQVVPFGNVLHVSGHDRQLLESSIAPLRREPYLWQRIDANLEEVFISLMRKEEGE